MSDFKRWIELSIEANRGPWGFDEQGVFQKETSNKCRIAITNITGMDQEIKDAEFIALSRSMPEKVKALVEAVNNAQHYWLYESNEKSIQYLEADKILKALADLEEE